MKKPPPDIEFEIDFLRWSIGPIPLTRWIPVSIRITRISRRIQVILWIVVIEIWILCLLLALLFK